MAREDIAAMEAAGIRPSPLQIVTLNALALRAERGPDAAEMVRAPRVAWAGSCTLHEPSMAAERWLQEFAFRWWSGTSATLAAAWACSWQTARQPAELADQTAEAAVRRRIEDWQRGLGCTLSQLLVALDYVLNDCDPEAPETARQGVPAADGCPYQTMVNDALAAGLGVTVAELWAQPRRILADILRRWLRNQAAVHGGDPSKLDSRHCARAYVAYEEYLAEVREGAADGKG
jgi:hypothetical protein